MGYYSFYKIIKDIIHTIFGRKFFRLLLIVLITFGASSLFNNVFASFDVIYGDNTYVFPDIPDNEYKYYLINRSSSNGRICLYLFNEDVYYDSTSTAGYIYSYSGNKFEYMIYNIQPNDGSIFDYSSYKWEYQGTYNNSSTYGTMFLNIIDCNFDLYDIDGNLVFSSSATSHNPYFSNADDLLDYDFKTMYINMGDLGVDDVVYLHKLEVDRTFEEDTGTIYYNQTVWKLNSNSEYYGITNDLVSYYALPRSVLALSSDEEYLFVLNDNSSSINATNGLYTGVGAYDILHLNPSNSVVTPEKEQTDAIKDNSNAINNLENTITSNEYDESQIKIDSSLSENIDENSYTNFITEIINSINNAITCDWNTVETVQIPLGFVDENITWKSDLLSAHIPQSLKIIINTFWMFLFGFYIFKFSLSLVNWLKSGEILDGKGFNNDEVITSNML